MVWSHYANEANMNNGSHHNNDTNNNDYDDLPYNLELTFDDWKTVHANDLYNMWHGLQCYVQDACIQEDILNNADYDTFCEFIFDSSTKRKSS